MKNKFTENYNIIKKLLMASKIWTYLEHINKSADLYVFECLVDKTLSDIPDIICNYKKLIDDGFFDDFTSEYSLLYLSLSGPDFDLNIDPENTTRIKLDFISLKK